jgi:DNA-binding PucR family transcriptional regulator
MILLQDPEMAQTLARKRLRALDALAPAERERLIDTLTAWLAHQRQTPPIAAALHVHPQTVRYRITRLRELLGDALDSPEGRFELELALRVRSAVGAGIYSATGGG